MPSTKKKTPKDATEFEREQLRFFLTREDLAATLAEMNPSLAWLPALAEMKLLQPGTQLAPWVERNFADADTVRDVATNIHFFDSDTADLLEFQLNREADKLPPILIKCWRLIIRQMRTAKRRLLRNDWFELAPRIKRGERSSEVLERLSDTLRPKLLIGKRLSWQEEGDRGAPERPSDLMSIDFEIEDGVNEEEILSPWSEDTPAEVEEKLLHALTNALSAALEDAVEAGVESNRGYSTSDSDVPSVAKHRQNAYRTGFLPIVRVVAEIWTRLARKDPNLALPFVERWSKSPLRLVRRLAAFAAADTVVPADRAADVLISLPEGEFFLTNSSVEVFRLMRARWHELPAEKRAQIEARIEKGPPADWLKLGADLDRIVNRGRFDLLGDMKRAGLELSAASTNLLDEIQKRWPTWQLRPAEQAGFHIWHESGSQIVGDAQKLQGILDDHLVEAAKQVADEADFMEGDAWQALCQNDPERALNGLESEARKGRWPAWAWNPFLWATQKIESADSLARIAELLLLFPKDQFSGISSSASWWLNEKAKTLDEKLLWPLWDRIEETVPHDVEEPDA